MVSGVRVSSSPPSANPSCLLFGSHDALHVYWSLSTYASFVAPPTFKVNSEGNSFGWAGLPLSPIFLFGCVAFRLLVLGSCSR